MNFILWHKKTVQKISSRNITLLLLGKVLVIFALGSFFQQYLVRWTAILLFLGIAAILNGLMNSYLNWHAGKDQKYVDYFLGFLGIFFIVLYFGTLFTDIPFPWAIMIIGIFLMLPGFWDVVKN